VPGSGSLSGVFNVTYSTKSGLASTGRPKVITSAIPASMSLTRRAMSAPAAPARMAAAAAAAAKSGLDAWVFFT
jgi:hypothetical protein